MRVPLFIELSFRILFFEGYLTLFFMMNNQKQINVFPLRGLGFTISIPFHFVTTASATFLYFYLTKSKTLSTVPYFSRILFIVFFMLLSWFTIGNHPLDDGSTVFREISESIEAYNRYDDLTFQNLYSSVTDYERILALQKYNNSLSDVAYLFDPYNTLTWIAVKNNTVETNNLFIKNATVVNDSIFFDYSRDSLTARIKIVRKIHSPFWIVSDYQILQGNLGGKLWKVYSDINLEIESGYKRCVYGFVDLIK